MADSVVIRGRGFDEIAMAHHPRAMIEELERDTFGYFDRFADDVTGLVRDSTKQDAPASIAGSGMALGCYVVAAERGYVSRVEAARRVRLALRFLTDANQEGTADGSGAHGFFYHFLDAHSGQRVGRCELSTIDSAILFAGALAAAAYFDGSDAVEREIRALGDALYRRADWQWASPRPPAVSHGWSPERGFLPYDWRGYNEALLLYVLALGSPTYPVPVEAYAEWTSTYRWKRLYGHDLLYAGPLFEHQGTHVWIDFNGIQDEYMRARGIDYFENSRRATYVQREYARRNPRGFAGYDANCWGITASDGPGPATHTLNGVERRFFDYRARGVPFGADDGTLSPWVVAAALPFAPEIVLPALQHINTTYPSVTGEYGYKCTFNPTFPANDGDASSSWISHGYYAIDQGPVVLMLENHRSGLIWQLLRRCPYIIRGLQRAGFAGGWLEAGQSDADHRATRSAAPPRRPTRSPP